ncbi:MAG: hypothetical protein GEV12_02100 [Micromonosporaceae bacterium]|nr:hypothetical protein [Micromonosporaceae bacterium]
MPTRTALVLGWLILLGGSFGLFALTAAAAWWQRRREVPGRARRQADRAEWERHRAAVAERYRQAAAELAAAQPRAAAAEQERAQSWQALEQADAAHDAADRRYAQAARRAGAGRPEPDLAGAREVAHAALAAYRRGDLSEEQLWRVWGWGTGWDPELSEREQALLRARAARREAFLRYQAAADRERAAAAVAGVAEVQARALAEEVATAAAEAQWEDGADERPARARSR